MKQSLLIVSFLILCIGIQNADTRIEESQFKSAAKRMVAEQIKKRGISDHRVLHAMEAVPRHLFVPEGLKENAYEDHPLPIGEGQTISQPYIVALMTESLNLKPTETVLEIGTGSGYQAAVLSHIAKQVFTIEIKEKLFNQAKGLLGLLGYGNIETFFGDGYFGLKEKAPFDGIMITAAVDHIPPPLLKQLKVGGRLVLPLGNPFGYQNLTLVTKSAKDYEVKQITGCLFVPMTGKALGK